MPVRQLSNLPAPPEPGVALTAAIAGGRKARYPAPVALPVLT